MFYGNTIQDTRSFFLASWQKHQHHKPLNALETQLVNVMLDHSGYYSWYEQLILMADAPFTSSLCIDEKHVSGVEHERPFLHLGLHLTIRDQILVDRPQGITMIFQKLSQKYADTHAVEHRLMAPLAQCLWESNHLKKMPDEQKYLQACKELLANDTLG